MLSISKPRAAGSWHGQTQLVFRRGAGAAGGDTSFQGSATAPLKLQRAYRHQDGRCELPLLHTAGGLVGGDQLTIEASLEARSEALLTSVAAQKVYGSVGRLSQAPEGRWVSQQLHFCLADGADLEWLPQELVLYADGLLEQRCRVELAPQASYLGVEVVRLGRTAAGEDLAAGCWRSALDIHRSGGRGNPWMLVDRLELGGEALAGEHGLARQPVYGSLVWAAPERFSRAELAGLLELCRQDRDGLDGAMACGALEPGLVARYRGPSSQAARFWFSRIWARIRAARGLPAPELPRVWPFQEQPWRPEGCS